MSAQELLTEQASTEWAEDLPKLITALNKKTKSTPERTLPNKPVCEGDSCNMLEKGTRVRVALEQPEDVAKGKRLHGTFRATDIRWNPEIRTIQQVIVLPNFPPMYALNGKDGKPELINYTKNQLQVVPKDEQYPSKELIKNPEKVEEFRVEKIVNKKKIKGKWFYEVKWMSYDESQNTWESAANLKKDVPDMVAEFEAQKGKGVIHHPIEMREQHHQSLFH
jgi:hypothetical protein